LRQHDVAAWRATLRSRERLASALLQRQRPLSLRFVPRFLLAVLLPTFVAVVRAHPEIEDALSRLNPQIAAQPTDASLYLERGLLYARHDDWVTAESNYLRAAELAPNHPRLPQALGTVALATGRVREACGYFDAALAIDPKDAEARVFRARARVALQNRSAAIADLNAALALIAQPPPELFLERARLLAPADAIRSLDEGIERLGPAVTLHLRALELEEQLGRINAAVARVDRIAAESERSEVWLKRRGDILSRAGRQAEARAAYAEALAAISALPAWLRESPEARRLAAEITRLTGSRS
jgi:tetratricopeptide (TPR) repeat protein